MQAVSFMTVGRNASNSCVHHPATRFFQTLIATFLLAALPSLNALGDPATADQARSVVQGWLRTDAKPLNTAMGAQVGKVATYKDAAGSPLYHVVSLSPNGYVIVAADDLVEPVVAFSDSGTFDPSTGNPLGAMVSRDIPNRMAKVKGLQRNTAQGVHLSARNKWDQLRARAAQASDNGTMAITASSGSTAAGVSDLRVAPLVQSTWDQTQSINEWTGSACYNYFTPPYGDGIQTNYYSGCVATAMAQLMRYWQYPVNGVGSQHFMIRYQNPNNAAAYITNNTHYLFGGDGVGGKYQWTNMVLRPAGGCTLDQLKAIGALCADAGASAHVTYGPASAGGSSAYLAYGYSQPSPLKSVFGYTNAIESGYYDNQTTILSAQLLKMVNPNLDAGCPVLFSIAGAPGGHAVVCDGYGYSSSTLYHHVNLGWSGSATAWYNLPNIDTTQAGQSDVFSILSGCVNNVWTNGAGEIISGRVTDGNTNGIGGVTVTATRSGGGIYTATTDKRGIYALARIPSSSTYTLSLSTYGSYAGFTNQAFATGLSQDYSATSGNYWGANFQASMDSYDPASFSATPAAPSIINLSWVKDAGSDPVMVAWSTDNIFGAPVAGVPYLAGDSIPGGGKVLYSGSASNNFSHVGRLHNTTYYYKAWSVRTGTVYSSGLSAFATSYSFGVPFSEGFEGSPIPGRSGDVGDVMPNGWTDEYVTNSVNYMPEDWWCQSGPFFTGAMPSGAHSGAWYAMLQHNQPLSIVWETKLVSPMIMFEGATNAILSFYLCNAWPWQDVLSVCYKTNMTAQWITLTNYSSSASMPDWTLQTLALPKPNNSYYVAFDTTASKGYGVSIDDILITATGSPKADQTITFPAIPGQSVNATVGLSATADSGLPVNYTVVSGPGSISGNNLICGGSAGTVAVVASQGGDGTWNAAPSVTNYVTVTSGSKTDQTITGFSTPASALTTNTFTLSATATPSGLPVAYTVISGPGLTNGSPTTLSFSGAGTVQVVASQAGNASYNAAPSITNTITVTKATALITLNNLTQTYNGTPRYVTASTVPAGLLTNITYNGSATAPTAMGSYAVTGSVAVTEAMYQGSASGTLSVNAAGAATYYVATNGSDAASGTSWATAKRTIQAGVDLAAAGDTVLVSNGVYATGGRVTPGWSLSNRVVITSAITVRSLNGAAVTTICGAMNSLSATNGDAAVRCIYMAANAVVSGFTLTNSHTRASGDGFTELRGGAVYCGDQSGIVSNCIVTGSSAYSWGGGAEGCTFYNCLFTGNWAGQGGGGSDNSFMYNCTVVGNAGSQGSGVQSCTLKNCIVYLNTGSAGWNYNSGSFDYTCTVPLPGSGSGNITSNPQFVNAAGGDFHLQAGSPCINAGYYAYAPGATDLDGHPRVANGNVDMGAYEWQATTTTVTVAAIGVGTVTGGGSYLPGSNILISAVATSGHWFFSQWNDSNTSATRTITVPSSDITYTATFTQCVAALTFYVATNGNDTADGHSWATARQTIQGGVDLTLAGDTVLVSNGVYATGVRVTPGNSTSNRVVITQNITVQSVNGAAVTVIRGLNGGSYSSADSVRCVYMNAGYLAGFTLTNGCAPNIVNDDCGGGVNGGGTLGSGGTVRNCVIANCAAYWGGGGAAYGTLNNCVLTGNSQSSASGGGGGAYRVLLNNCTLWGNSASVLGGGTYYGTLNNCIVYTNSAPSNANYTGNDTLNYCCTTPSPSGGSGNITSNPLYVNAAARDFHLQAGSPCINAGNNTYTNTATDLDGNPRVVSGTVDMGAYEYQSASTVSLTASCGANGTVSPASTNAAIGSSPVFAVNAATYYRILSVSTNGASVGNVFDNNSTATNFTWGNVQAAGTLYATFTDRVTSDPGHATYAWLAGHGLATDTNAVNGSYSDTDHDGLKAWQEFLAGTDPTNAASVLRMQSVTSAGGSNTVKWLSSASVVSKYNLFSCTNLANGVWTLYTNNITATPPTNSLTLPTLGRPRMFFKVSVTN